LGFEEHIAQDILSKVASNVPASEDIE